MPVPFFARRFQPQVEQSLKALPHRRARSCRTAEQTRCDWSGWLQLRWQDFTLLNARTARKSQNDLEFLCG